MINLNQLNDGDLDLSQLGDSLPEDIGDDRFLTDSNYVLKVFHKARNGEAVNLEALLTQIPESKRREILEQSYLDKEQNQLCSPLVIAARNGHSEVVKTLITKVSTYCPI